MHQFHGWFQLAEATEETDLGGLRDAVDRLRARIADAPAGVRAAVEFVNVAHFLTLTGNPNRRRDTWVEDTLEFVRTTLPGSWGLLYERDDETTLPPGPNAFRVTVLARGELSVRADPFLSPCVPVIED
ncbi:Imm7 family immunity protein [Saccharothrix hoggarensis]|uniref:Imm7 family immunity protein n=1 Tax=Saccharothrix hoggarensis TaxID=913853 RepID=A0ABW3R3C8_9PSEU